MAQWPFEPMLPMGIWPFHWPNGHNGPKGSKRGVQNRSFWTPFLTPFGGSEPGWPNGPLSLCSQWGFGPFIGHMARMAQKGQKGGPKPVILDPFLTPSDRSEPGWPNGHMSLCSRWGFGPFIGHMARMAQKGQKGVKKWSK